MRKLTSKLSAVFTLAIVSGSVVAAAAVFAEETKSAETKSAETKSAETNSESKTGDAKVENKDGNEYCSINDPKQASPIKFSCINHHGDCAEAENVIKTLSLYAKAYVSKDYKTCAEYMTDDITTFDSVSKKLVQGKDAVLADMKERLDKSNSSDSPLISYTLDHPLAHVKGDKATVNCIGIKVYGGKHPRTMESHSNYVFIKQDGKWKKSHFTTDWKQVVHAG